MFGKLIASPKPTLEEALWEKGRNAATKGLLPLDEDFFRRDNVFDCYFYYSLGYREIIATGL